VNSKRRKAETVEVVVGPNWDERGVLRWLEKKLEAKSLAPVIMVPENRTPERTLKAFALSVIVALRDTSRRTIWPDAGGRLRMYLSKFKDHVLREGWSGSLEYNLDHACRRWRAIKETHMVLAIVAPKVPPELQHACGAIVDIVQNSLDCTVAVLRGAEESWPSDFLSPPSRSFKALSAPDPTADFAIVLAQAAKLNADPSEDADIAVGDLRKRWERLLRDLARRTKVPESSLRDAALKAVESVASRLSAGSRVERRQAYDDAAWGALIALCQTVDQPFFDAVFADPRVGGRILWLLSLGDTSAFEVDGNCRDAIKVASSGNPPLVRYFGSAREAQRFLERVQPGSTESSPNTPAEQVRYALRRYVETCLAADWNREFHDTPAIEGLGNELLHITSDFSDPAFRSDLPSSHVADLSEYLLLVSDLCRPRNDRLSKELAVRASRVARATEGGSDLDEVLKLAHLSWAEANIDTGAKALEHAEAAWAKLSAIKHEHDESDVVDLARVVRQLELKSVLDGVLAYASFAKVLEQGADEETRRAAWKKFTAQGSGASAQWTDAVPEQSRYERSKDDEYALTRHILEWSAIGAKPEHQIDRMTRGRAAAAWATLLDEWRADVRERPEKTRVFISYRNALNARPKILQPDGAPQGFVNVLNDRLAEDLGSGFDVWCDLDGEPGGSWSESILTHLFLAHVVVIVDTPLQLGELKTEIEYDASQFCRVEQGIALKRHDRENGTPDICPIAFDEKTDLDRRFFPVHAKPAAWDGPNFDGALNAGGALDLECKRLVTALTKRIRAFARGE